MIKKYFFFTFYILFHSIAAFIWTVNESIRHRNKHTNQTRTKNKKKPIKLQQPVSPFSFVWVLVFLLSRAAKPISSLGSTFSASSPNSILITTPSLYNYRNEVKQNITFFGGMCCTKNSSRSDIRLMTQIYEPNKHHNVLQGTQR